MSSHASFLNDHEPQHDPVWLATINNSLTFRSSRMTAPKTDSSSPSPVNVPSSNRRDTPESIDLRQATEAKRHPSPHSTPIQFHILDLNSNPIRPESPYPVLRRTASGRLFQPSNRVIHTVEMLDPVMTEEEESEELAKWARGEDVGTGKRRGNTKGKSVMARNGRVAGEVRRLEVVSSGSLPLTPLGLRVEFGSDVDEHDGGETEHERSSEGPVQSGRPRCGVVSATLSEHGPNEGLRGATGVEDVWIDLAKE